MTVVDLNFQRASYAPELFSYQRYVSLYGVTKAKAKRIVRKLQSEQVMRSDTHQVCLNAVDVPPPFGQGLWLSIKRLDKSVIDDRLELAHIMRALKPGHGGFELFPAPDRLVDTSNQYHLTIFERHRLVGLVDLPLGPVHRHATGSDYQDLVDSDGSAHVMAALDGCGVHDWRQLYELKERCWPGCEAVMYHDSDGNHPYHGKLLVLRNSQLRFPFGFSERAVSDVEHAMAVGAAQRALTSYSVPPPVSLAA